VSNIDLPVLRKHAIDGSKRLRRVVPVITAVALSVSLLAAVAGPASAAVREPARTAMVSSAASDNGLPAVSLTSAVRYVHLSDGRLILDTAKAIPAGIQDTTITVLPGITLSITSTGIQLSMTADAVTEIENVAGFAENVATLVGNILDLALIGIQNGGAIASSITGLVADGIGIGSDFLRFCTASNGSATFTIPWPWLWPSLGLPSCSGVSL
jgi:hypothetical protein